MLAAIKYHSVIIYVRGAGARQAGGFLEFSNWTFADNAGMFLAMQITGITPEQFSCAVAEAAKLYQGNMRAEFSSVQSNTRFRARIVPYQSGAAFLPVGVPAPGARLSWNGRRIKASCWHAYRDVMIEVFRINPKARIATGLAVYKGIEGFEANYPRTAYMNIGSMMSPAYMPDLCDCEQ